MIPKLMLFGSALAFAFACSEKNFVPDDPQASFTIAKEPYDDGNYEIALTKLGEFRTRFPYSHYAAEAEILAANCHFELGHYDEAAAAFQQFIKLHPKNAQRSYAQYKIGESYWSNAPEEVNREQDLTAKAIQEWQLLVANDPQSSFATKATELIEKGQRRIAESEAFVAAFYCKQEVWHACAYRYAALAENSPPKFGDIIKTSLEEAARAFEKLADFKAPENARGDENLYVRKLSSEDMRTKAKELREKAKTLATIIKS